jgi:hypothetical protein
VIGYQSFDMGNLSLSVLLIHIFFNPFGVLVPTFVKMCPYLAPLRVSCEVDDVVVSRL